MKRRLPSFPPPAPILLSTLDRHALEDIEDILHPWEASLGVRWQPDTFKSAATLEDLIQAVAAAAGGGPSAPDCTTQQAFYRLRDALGASGWVTRQDVTPGLALRPLFPVWKARHRIRILERHLGFPLKWRGVHPVVTCLLALVFLTGFGVVWKAWLAGTILMASAVACYQALRYGLPYVAAKTVGQAAGELARQSYAVVRRRPGTANREELVRMLRADFAAGR